MHHIFPKNSSSVKGKFSDDEINSIVNICFLPKESNQSISSANPSKYFIDKVKEKNTQYYEEDLENNLIPNYKDSGIWDDNFKKFLMERTKLINKKIKELTKY